MAFVIKKQSKNKTFHYLVESIREDGKIKHRPILAMGEHQTLDSLLASIKEKMEKTKDYIQLYEGCYRYVESGLKPQRKEHTWSLEYLARIIGYRRINLENQREEYEHIKGLKERYFSVPKISSGVSRD